MLSAGDLEQVLEAGGDLRVRGLSERALVQLAAVARQSGSKIEIAAEHLSPDIMIKIAKSAAGHVLFDLTQ